MREYYSERRHLEKEKHRQMVILYRCHTMFTPDKTDTPQCDTCQLMKTKQKHMQVITRKAKIKYVALLNVLFYKWLGYPAGISGWHCAAVTTTMSPTHACLSIGASPQKSNVRCYPSPLIEKDPAHHRGWGGPASHTVTEKHHYWAPFALLSSGCHECSMTTWLLTVYFISNWAQRWY